MANLNELQSNKVESAKEGDQVLVILKQVLSEILENQKREININPPSEAFKARLEILRSSYPNTWE